MSAADMPLELDTEALRLLLEYMTVKYTSLSPDGRVGFILVLGLIVIVFAILFFNVVAGLTGAVSQIIKLLIRFAFGGIMPDDSEDGVHTDMINGMPVTHGKKAYDPEISTGPTWRRRKGR